MSAPNVRDAPAASETESLYQALPDVRDEAFSADRSVRPAWQGLFESIGRHQLPVIETWQREADRIARERGLAYRYESLEKDHVAGWRLDPIPWIFSEADWARIDAGLSQRLQLYDLILRDLYGEQTLLKDAKIPRAIIYRHSQYVRALVGYGVGDRRGEIRLGMSGFDLSLDATGTPFVINDRYDCPFGLGLALENRSITNRVLPRLFRRNRIRQVGPFFESWFQFLQRHGEALSEEPTIAIADVDSEHRDAEIGFLSNYCGMMRVHPEDLTVRDGRVSIRALQGLVPIDVIWRTTSGAGSDALESEQRSEASIAGLFQALRVGGVAMASHPGCGLLQCPAFYPFLRQLCRDWLDQDIILPSVATWWCGQPKERDHVLANLDNLVIKSAFHHHSFNPVRGCCLSQEEKAKLKQQILHSPEAFVGQEDALVSTVPTTRGRQLIPERAALRVFGFLDDVEGAQVM
ncbi:MAG: circularly permuted type 2 ATP-grasp protein, partial [Verrucomicrobiota bacterium]